MPTLLLTGSDSRDPSAADAEALAAALPDARVLVLEGQHHVADVLAPELFARHLLGFLGHTAGVAQAPLTAGTRRSSGSARR